MSIIDVRYIRAAVAAIAGLFILTFTVPWQPVSAAGVGPFDYSWMLLLNDAIATGRQFGNHIILPQGPLGFIGTFVYDPRTYWWIIAARSLIALVALRSMWEASRKFVPNPLLALPWLLAIILLIGESTDHFFPGVCVILIFNYFNVHDRKLTLSDMGLIVLLSASSLIKVNQPFYAFVVLGTLTLDQIIQRRPWFWIPSTIYVGAWLLLYLAARQRPANLPGFLWDWEQVALGHADAVGMPGPWTDPVAYLAVVAMTLALIGRYEWKTWRRSGALPTAALAGVLILLYKHSFMRQDIAHVHMGPMVVTATAILFLPALWPLGETVWRGMCIAVVAIAATVLSSIMFNYTGRSLLSYAMAAPGRCLQNMQAAATDITDPTRLARKREADRAQLRRDYPLAIDKIEGTVDVYPHRQDIVFAYDLNYQPRPVVSSLVATSQTLADLNDRHLRGPTAPDTILFDIDLIDMNYPTMLDGQSIPDLLTRYDVIDSTGGLLILRRAPLARTYRFVLMLRTTAHFNQVMPIPTSTDAPIWAKIHFKKRLAGNLIAAIYKPPYVLITVHPSAGEDNSYRLLPSLAVQGFLLSPLLKDRSAYARLASRSWRKDLKSDTVAAMTISVYAGSQDASFDPNIEIELDRLEFEHQGN